MHSYIVLRENDLVYRIKHNVMQSDRNIFKMLLLLMFEADRIFSPCLTHNENAHKSFNLSFYFVRGIEVEY